MNVIVTAQPGQGKNKKPLTREAFDKFLRWLNADRDLAGVKYEEIRKRMVRFFVHKGCDDPHELFEITIDRVVGILDTNPDYSSPLGLCFGVGRMVWLEEQKNPRTDSLDGYDIPVPDDDDPKLHEQQLKCLEECLDKLSEDDRDLIRKYHMGQGRDKIQMRKQLASEYGGNNILRIRTFRIRARLRICVDECVKRAVN